MPITASLGALTYAKTNLGDDFEYWFLRTTNNYQFNSLTFDASDNFYVNATSGTIIKFAEIPFPAPVWTKVITPLNASNYIEYNSASGLISHTGTTQWQSSVFPNPSNGTRMIYGTIALSNPTSESITAWGHPDAAVARFAYGTVLINKSSTDLFIGGKFPQIGGTDYAFILEASTGYRGGISASSANTYDITGLALDSSNRAVFLGTLETSNTTGRRVVIGKLPSAPSTFPNLLYPSVWQRQLTSTQTLSSQKLKSDSSNNYYGVMNDSSYAYIVKYNDSGVLQWQRRIASTTLYDLSIDGSSIYVVGNNSSNNLFVAEYDNTGSLQWQNKLSGLTFAGRSITYTSDGLYIAGTGSSTGVVVKLPNDGSIPSAGSYNLGGGVILTYSTDTQTESAGTLTEAINADSPGGDTPTSTPDTKTINNQTNTNTIISL